MRVLDSIHRPLPRAARLDVRIGVVSAIALGVKLALAPVPARAAELPIACSAGTCGSFVSSGSASAVLRNQSLDVTQTTQNAVLNWQSFNIGAGATVTFEQPNSSAIALNRIHQESASKIYGALNANGRVYLINQNGILFGDGARINVGGLIASSLDITQEALENGIVQAATNGRPAFAQQPGQPSGSVAVEQGARIETAAGGQVFLFAPTNVTNEGSIATPDGQTILAAGQSVYLATSGDENLRGILVEVDAGGEVTNGKAGGAVGKSPQDIIGQIVAERGNVTLAGLAVNQLGRASATTSVRANGSIRLQARDTVIVTQAGDIPLLAAQKGGELTVGPHAVNEVTLQQADSATQVDVNRQLPSTVLMDGAQVRLLENSRTTATAGKVDIFARGFSQASPTTGSFAPEADDSKLYVANGATIDVSGANIELPMERHVVRAELRASQLANSPEQRSGALRGQAVYVDARRTGTRADGTVWHGTPLADVSGDIAAVGRTIGERSLIGGTVNLQSQGSVLVADNALIDIAGGSIRYLDGHVTTTQLLADGRVYDIAAADPARAYDGIGNTFIVEHPKWGVTETFTSFGGGTATHFERGYVEGKDAGALSVVAPWFSVDGRIDGSTVRGMHQRLPSAPLADGAVYRAYDQVPIGGQLVIGFADPSPVQNFVVGDVAIEPGLVLPSLRRADGTPFDPSQDLPPTEVASRLRPSLIGPEAVSNVAIHSNGRVTLPHGMSLSLPLGGQFTATAANLAIDGVISAPSGSIALAARPSITTLTGVSMVVGGTAALRAVGRWVNDSVLTNVDGAILDPLNTNGGRVSLVAQQGGLALEAGSRIDVSAGAWLTADGNLRTGTGGSVSLATTPDSTAGQVAAAVPLRLDGQIRGHSAGEGGKLTITSSAICIADTDCARDSTELWVAPELLEASGFGAYQLSSNRGGVTLRGGTEIDLRQRSLVLDGRLAQRPSAESVTGFSRLTTLDDLHRSPVDLALTAATNTGEVVSGAAVAGLPGLFLGTESRILGDPGANIALSANTVIDVDGTLSAPAGSISVELSNSLSLSLAPDSRGTQFPDAQGIWLGGSARLLSAGAVRSLPNDLGLREGEVLQGGTVSLTAQRGYIVTLPGSVVDVSGTAATLDLRSTPAGGYQATSVAGDAGSIAVTAAEGMVLSGELLGAAAGASGARGGDLLIALDPFERGDRGTPASLFPLGARTIILNDDSGPLVIGPRTNVPRSFNGIARVAASDVKRGGFDSLRLSARELEKRSTGPLELGEIGVIRFEGDVNLDLARSIELDAAVIDGSGGNATLRAPFVSIGASSRLYQSSPTSIVDGSGTLAVAADLLELSGNVTLQGIDTASFSSSGDIRVRGVQLLNSQLLQGSLVTGGDLVLAGDQLYPTTLTRFGLLSKGAGRSIRVLSTGERRAPVLSAGGQLTLEAETVEQLGTLRAPFGEITLTGEHVILDSGSLTSTSGAGSSILFGQTQGGFDWVYPLRERQTLVFGRGDDELPQQRVTLDGTDVRVKFGATIDVSGGGDLLAYEFEPGVNGTRDVLSNALRPNQFAVLPSLDLEYAPFDPSISVDSALHAGDRVWLAGLGDLQAGFYTLLPARYALLAGSYLVTAKGGYTDIVPGERLNQLDGGTVIAGYRATANTDRRDSRYSGFEVRPGTDSGREAHYTQTKATQFFYDLASSLGNAPPRLPVDAGILSVGAGSGLELAGSLIANGGENGRGAGVDVSATQLRIVPSPTVAGPDEVLIEASALNSLGAESLLLGASRAHASDGIVLDVAAKRVTIGAGSELRAPEVIVAATDRVDVETGAVIAATGVPAGDDEALSLQGSGALLRVSSGAQVRVDRELAGTALGALSLAEGSVLRSAGGAVLLDATGDSSLRGQLEIPGASLNLSASRISLGQDSDPASGLILDAAQLAALDLDELVLTSRSTLDLYGNVDLGVRDLTVHAAGIVNRSSGGDAALAAQRTLQLANPNGVAMPSAANGSGTLTLVAQQIELGAGDFVIDGVATAEIRSSAELRALEIGNTRVLGNLDIAAPSIATASGAERTIEASGVLSTRTATSSFAGAGEPAGIGGRLVLRGENVVHGGRIEMPGGDVEIAATGGAATDNVTLASGSIISVRGATREFDGMDLFAPAGNVSLAAGNGSIVAEAGSTVDVSGAAGGGDAGTIVARAARGSLAVGGSWLGTAAAGYRGGSVLAAASDLSQFDALVHALNSAGFTEALEFRRHGVGDLSLGGPSVAAHSISFTADQGALSVLGVLDARGTSGGSIDLMARDDVRIAGTLLGSATEAGGRGGRVSISSARGGVRLEQGSHIDVTAGVPVGAEPVRAGEVAVRVSREAAGTVLDGSLANDAVVLAGEVAGAGRYWLEGYEVYESADGLIDFADVAPSAGNPLYDAAAAFMSNAGAIVGALGRSGDANFKVVPGVEVRSAADLTLAADWNLYDWHFANDTPGILTLRAGGNLVFERSLSDGFAYLPDPNIFDPDVAARAFTLDAQPRESWSYRLIGGADLSSVDFLATALTTDVAGSPGDVKVSPGTCCIVVDPFSPPDYRMIRTGTGDIVVRAAGDFVLGNADNRSALDQTATLYTAGVAGPGIRLPGDFGGLNLLPYPIDGGDISIRVGGSVSGAVSNQLVTDWLWRVGRPSDASQPSPTAWTVNHRSFMQGIGALAGGDVEVRADADIENLSVSLPTIGRQVGGRSVRDNDVEIIGEGRLRVTAGGSIFGGTYLIGNGSAALRSRRGIGAPVISQVPGLSAFGPLLGFSGSGEFDLVARTNLSIESAFNATLIPQGYSQQVLSGRSYFSTYSDESRLSLTAVTGTVTLNNDPRTAETLFSASAALTVTDSASLVAYPGTVRAAAFDGDVSIPRSMFLFPAPKGNLELLAERSVNFARPDTAMVLTLSDADESVLPSIDRPVGDLSLLDALVRSPFDSRHHARVPVHSLEAQADGLADLAPVRVIARTGDIFMNVGQQAGLTGIYLSKPARFVAAGDIRDLTLLTQHSSAQDITSLQAGGDIFYRLGRNALGILEPNSGSLVVDGPGLLELIAGQDLDLQTSSGVVTRGNLFNAALPSDGASISVLVGLGASAPEYERFTEDYLIQRSDYDATLLAYVSAAIGETISNKAQAIEIFRSLRAGARSALLQTILFAEIRKSGREAAASANADFTRGFAALEAIFPRANPDIEAGETNPYAGDINLYFSRIYTLDGGDIDLMAPGGQINAGLATPPTAFGITKTASELGIVAQSSGNVSALPYGNFAVNESRVFAADGGDILVWSTRGDIDAGRGAKTAISAPPPVLSFDANGNVRVNFPAALAGSGIQTLATSAGRKPGDVDLFAPRGVVNAGDAGIVAGNLTIAATAVLGADNISVSGVAVGVPVDTGGFGAALTGVSAVASSATSAAEDTVGAARDAQQSTTPLADQALGFLDVFVTGFGEANCDPQKESCPEAQ